MAAKSATKTSARGWERKRANRATYEETLDAAAHSLSRNGYDGTILADIAKSVGIRTPALYYHFKSENATLYPYLHRCAEQTNEPVAKAIAEAGPDPVDRLRAYVKAYIGSQLELIDTMPMVNTMLFNSSVAKALTKSQYKWVRDWERKMIDAIRKILEDGANEGVFKFRNLTPTAFFIMGTIDYVVNWYRPDGDLTVEELADEYADLVLASVSA
ncbi:MAG: TetR/AcrR family transcriptional regulator [Gammaproteobacteria bacterium]|nr:TetR/AcrR family transcriptional regulator [Gammaproteobacteria bacterium]